MKNGVYGGCKDYAAKSARHTPPFFLTLFQSLSSFRSLQRIALVTPALHEQIEQYLLIVLMYVLELFKLNSTVVFLL